MSSSGLSLSQSRTLSTTSSALDWSRFALSTSMATIWSFIVPPFASGADLAREASTDADDLRHVGPGHGRYPGLAGLGKGGSQICKPSVGQIRRVPFEQGGAGV